MQTRYNCRLKRGGAGPNNYAHARMIFQMQRQSWSFASSSAIAASEALKGSMPVSIFTKLIPSTRVSVENTREFKSVGIAWQPENPCGREQNDHATFRLCMQHFDFCMQHFSFLILHANCQHTMSLPETASSKSTTGNFRPAPGNFRPWFLGHACKKWKKHCFACIRCMPANTPNACNLHACNFHACNLHACNFHACNLHACNLHACNFHACNLHACNLHACNLHACNLHACNLHACNLHACNLHVSCMCMHDKYFACKGCMQEFAWKTILPATCYMFQFACNSLMCMHAYTLNIQDLIASFVLHSRHGGNLKQSSGIYMGTPKSFSIEFQIANLYHVHAWISNGKCIPFLWNWSRNVRPPARRNTQLLWASYVFNDSH